MAGGRLTTHVLDTAQGRPAAGLSLALYRFEGERRVPLGERTTNHDGRLATPLLEGDAMTPGVYELIFAAGDYLRAGGVTMPEPPFLDEVVIRFGIADASEHYHVPLLLAPFGYSTYRGS
ncbi:MAG: hydroxyisourate hydrolase [Geminicoccaceae bacterium]